MSLKSRGLPSMFDLPPSLLERISRTLDGAARVKSRIPPPTSMKGILENTTQLSMDMYPALHDLAALAPRESKPGDRIRKFLSSIDKGDFHTTRDALAPICVGRDVRPKILSLYYQTLIQVGDFVVLFADASRRVLENDIEVSLYIEVVTALAKEGLHGFVARLLMNGRRRFGHVQSFHETCAIGFELAGKPHLAKIARARAEKRHEMARVDFTRDRLACVTA
jgi:hypothetical protein